MDRHLKRSRAFLRALNALWESTLIFLILLLLCTLSSCKQEMDYFPYVSELRSNVFLAETNGFSLRVYAVTKESPYRPDGIPRERNTRLEAYLTAPEGNKTCRIFLSIDGQDFQGEMSYDGIKAEYFFSCSADVSQMSTLPCRIEYNGKTVALNAFSIRQNDTLSAQEILKTLQGLEVDLFTSLTDSYGFAGEIYIRLIYEENPYYYVGVIDRKGKVNAFLLNAQTGKLLAKRTV